MIRSFSRCAPGTLVLAGALALSSAARADGPLPQPTEGQHEGFFMRFLLGPSLLVAATTDDDDDDVTLSGWGGTFHVALGYNIIPRLVVYAELFDDVTFNPKVEINGSAEEDLEDTTLGLFGLGLGLAYYFPSEFYISASAVAGQLQANVTEGDTVTTEETGVGFGVNAVLGKDFWVSDTWALGIAAQIFVGSVPAGEEDETDSWGVAAVALAVSATYD